MEIYSHLDYCQQLFDQLQGMDNYLESCGEESPSVVDEKLGRLRGTVLVAIDDEDVESELTKDEVMLSGYRCAILLIAPAKGSAYADIRAAREKVKLQARQVIARLMQDFVGDGPAGVIPKITRKTVGPYADNYYGYLIEYSGMIPESYEIDKEAWK